MPDLAQWHDFFVLIGSASATLVGLMFVAASTGAGVFTSEHQVGIHSFLSPTVVHFSAVLIVCLFATFPTQNRVLFSVVQACVGVTGLIYSVVVSHRMFKHGIIATIDLADRLWYVVLPMGIYLLMIAAGASLWQRSGFSLEILATALVLLMLIGIRNAWDMTVWIIDRRRP